VNAVIVIAFVRVSILYYPWLSLWTGVVLFAATSALWALVSVGPGPGSLHL
jgi:hypothetical protein